MSTKFHSLPLSWLDIQRPCCWESAGLCSALADKDVDLPSSTSTSLRGAYRSAVTGETVITLHG